MRRIGTSRNWAKSYSIASALTRNPKTPPAISLRLLSRLSERDVKMIATDRNLPEAVRLASRRILTAALERKK